MILTKKTNILIRTRVEEGINSMCCCEKVLFISSHFFKCLAKRFCLVGLLFLKEFPWYFYFLRAKLQKCEDFGTVSFMLLYPFLRYFKGIKQTLRGVQ